MTDHMSTIPSDGPASSAGGRTAGKSIPGEDVFLIDMALQEQYAMDSINHALDHWRADLGRLEIYMFQAMIAVRVGREFAAQVRALPPHRLRAALAQRPGVVIRSDGVVARVAPAAPAETGETSGGES